jgi:hypothetical protein
MSDNQFSATIFYIHKNPVHHGYCEKITDWEWSSYKAIMGSISTFQKRFEIIDWFGNKERFIEFHQQPIYLKNAVALEV